jgi:hypothetical protein
VKIFYTKHAEEKLKRSDIKKFGIGKTLIEKILKHPERRTKTKYEDMAVVSKLTEEHSLRIIYDIIDKNIKVITFHIHKTGRYV